MDVIDPNMLWQAEGDTITEQQRMDAARGNHGFKTIRWLPGNVGYVDIHLFPSLEYSGKKAVSVMGVLADCDALIFDCRNHHGGDDRMLCFVASYFFKNVTLLHSFYYTYADSTEQVWTHAFVPGTPLYDKPLYVLTSRGTGSGGEAFAYAMKHHGRGTVIGDTTKGMAHPVEFYRVPSLDVQIQVPYGRPISPVTGTSWEGIGVAPDMVVPSDDAFNVAYLKALEGLRAKSTAKDIQRELDWAIDGVRAKVEPVSLDEATTQRYRGQYGTSAVVYKDDALYYKGVSGSLYRLVPLTNSLFTFEDDDEMRVQFVTDDAGTVTELRLLYYAGYVIPRPRTGD